MLSIQHKGQTICYNAGTVDEAEAWIAGHKEATDNKDADYVIVGRRSDWEKK